MSFRQLLFVKPAPCILKEVAIYCWGRAGLLRLLVLVIYVGEPAPTKFMFTDAAKIGNSIFDFQIFNIFGRYS